MEQLKDCKDRNCNATDGVESEMMVVRKAIDACCKAIRDPMAGFTMITNTADLSKWLLKYAITVNLAKENLKRSIKYRNESIVEKVKEIKILEQEIIEAQKNLQV